MQPRTKLAICAAVVLVAALLIYSTRTPSSDEAATSAHASAHSPALTTIGATKPTPNDSDAAPPTSPIDDDRDANASEAHLLFKTRWGSGRGELGRERTQEGNPEGPMSLAHADDDLLVLDQVNGRLSRFDRDGKLVRTSTVPTTVQDLAVAKDGTVALIDRLVGKTVTLVDPNGRKIGELPLGAKVSEGGLVTAVVADGRKIYVEKEHGALVLLGSTDGTPAEEASELTGRPSKDGALLLSAGLRSPREGRAFLNAVDRRTGALRFSRAIHFPHPSQSIVLLDSDAKGTIYLGVSAGAPGDAHVACLDPSDGHLLGRVVIPLSHTPEESFRDITVGSDGSIVFALRTEDSVEYRAARCP